MTPYTHEKRGAMHPGRVARIYARCEGRCASCGRKLLAGDDYEIDHRIALANGGTDDDDNLQIMCVGCHILKTGDDVTEAAKGKRRYSKTFVPNKFRSSKWR